MATILPGQEKLTWFPPTPAGQSQLPTNGRKKTLWKQCRDLRSFERPDREDGEDLSKEFMVLMLSCSHSCLDQNLFIETPYKIKVPNTISPIVPLYFSTTCDIFTIDPKGNGAE